MMAGYVLVRTLGVLLLAFVLFASIFVGFQNFNLLRAAQTGWSNLMLCVATYLIVAFGFWLAARRKVNDS